jgi:hypothetical protein
MFEQAIPCPHQIYRGAATSPWKTDAKLIYEKGNTSIEIHLTIFPRLTKLQDDSRREWLKTLTRNNIKHFSRTKQSKAVIHSWVEQKWPTDIGDRFALGIPLTILSLIAYGVNEFAMQSKKSINQDKKGTEHMKKLKGQAKQTAQALNEVGEEPMKVGDAQRPGCGALPAETQD